MTENEREVMDNAVSPHPKYWLPCEWVFALLKKAREEKRIESDHYLIAMLEVRVCRRNMNRSVLGGAINRSWLILETHRKSKKYRWGNFQKINLLRLQVATLACYDWVPVPLLYTQVVSLAVHSYFVVALMGRQYLLTDRDIPNASSVTFHFYSILQHYFCCCGVHNQRRTLNKAWSQLT